METSCVEQFLLRLAKLAPHLEVDEPKLKLEHILADI